jgi:hypothetical protein
LGDGFRAAAGLFFFALVAVRVLLFGAGAVNLPFSADTPPAGSGFSSLGAFGFLATVFPFWMLSDRIPHGAVAQADFAKRLRNARKCAYRVGHAKLRFPLARYDGGRDGRSGIH